MTKEIKKKKSQAEISLRKIYNLCANITDSGAYDSSHITIQELAYKGLEDFKSHQSHTE